MVDDPSDRTKTVVKTPVAAAAPAGVEEAAASSVFLPALGLFRGRGLILSAGYPRRRLLSSSVAAVPNSSAAAETATVNQTRINPSSAAASSTRSNSEKANIYESLDSTGNPIPEATNLQRFAPAVGDQGTRAAASAWSSAYAARTIEEAARSGVDPNSLRFQPIISVNQIGLETATAAISNGPWIHEPARGPFHTNQFPYSDKTAPNNPTKTSCVRPSNTRCAASNR